MEVVTWKPIPKTQLLISNTGIVWDTVNNCRKQITVGKDFWLVFNTQQTTLYIHREVARAFLPKSKYSNKKWVRHKDGNKHNNHVNNLEWYNRFSKTKKIGAETSATTEINERPNSRKQSIH